VFKGAKILDFILSTNRYALWAVKCFGIDVEKFFQSSFNEGVIYGAHNLAKIKTHSPIKPSN